MKFKLSNLDQFNFNSFQVIFIKGLGILITYILILFITNFFPEELVGEYNFANNILLIFGTICLFGANQSIYQLGSKILVDGNTANLKKLYIKYMLISFCIYLFILTLTFVIPESLYQKILGKENIYPLITKTVSFAFVYFLASLNFEMFRILNKIKASEIYRSIFRLVIFFIGVLIIYFLDYQSYLVEAFLTSFLLTSIVTTYSVLKLLNQNSKNELDLSINYKKIIKVSLPMSISALFILLMQSIDSFFIIKYNSFKELAYYSTAIRITTLVSIVLTSINTIIAPEISENFFKKDFKKLREIIFKASKLNFLLSIPLLLCLLLFPNTILGFFGDNYTNAKIALIILCVGQIVNSFCGSVGLYLNMTGKQNELLLLLLLALILNIIFNVILVPKYGINGAAISSCISLAFWNILGLIFIYYKDKVVTSFRIYDKGKNTT
ncbi:hypothetical protein FJ651_05355 [Paucihalobacter ruber]|uniref:Polysaccharide biosynthesis protein C-terminal domain-containing protein n=1 Tax=Paucihalobacter ruber TaxID=2567861 RepID=A0A506PP01_9FLAO|nr:MATE family efflux transporter [Paucihalobacter ruber]TPV34955.1 hypothetical protein FJ651_05355 [Paucihalobacter ruber]